MNGLPEVVARDASDDRLDLALLVPADSPWFEGHFPGHPILPGVVQIGWAAEFAARWTGSDTPPTLLERIKFKRPVRPGAGLVLRLHAKAGKLSFEYLLRLPEATVVASSGTFSAAESVS